MNYIIDIETAPDESNTQLIESLLADAKQTTKTTLEDAQKKIRNKFALSPLSGQIVSVACIMQETNGVHFGKDYYDSFSTQQTSQMLEREILSLLAIHFEKFSGTDTLVTFNGQSFDIPFLQIRCAKHRIRLPKFKNKKYDLTQCIDLRGYLTNWEQFGEGTLEEWCLMLEIEFPQNDGTGIKGYEIPQLFQLQQFNLIKLHNENDCLLTYRLFDKLRPYITI